MTPTPLTDRQAEVLAAIRAYWRDHGRPPAYRDLMLVLGIRSPNGLASQLDALGRKGVIEVCDERGPHLRATSRGIWPAGLRARIRDLLTDDTTGSPT